VEYPHIQPVLGVDFGVPHASGQTDTPNPEHSIALTDTAVRNTKPRDKAFKLFDGGGLFLMVNPNGSRYWRLKYRIKGKEKLLALGVYPDVSLIAETKPESRLQPA